MQAFVKVTAVEITHFLSFDEFLFSPPSQVEKVATPIT